MQSYSMRRAALLASVLGFSSVPASAAIPNSFDVTDQWTVTPAAQSGADAAQGGLPCILSNQYDNGFKIRFTGGNNQVLMMAIDFQQKIFAPGQAYDTAISVGQAVNAKQSGKAFNESTLLFDVRGINGFYQALSASQNMVMDVQGNQFGFSLKQIQPALARMDACAAPKGQPEVKDAMSAPSKGAMPAAMMKAEVKEAAKPIVSASVSEDDLKEREVYVRRRVKPEDAEAELAGIETQAGDEQAADAEAKKYPEPIDLLREASSEPQKAVSIEPANTVKTIADDAPVLVSRRDGSMSMEMADQDKRPADMALFEGREAPAPQKQQAPYEPVVMAQTEGGKMAAPVKPAVKPEAAKSTPAEDVPTQEAVQPASQKTAQAAPAPQPETGDDFLQQSLEAAQQDIAKAEAEMKDMQQAKVQQKTPMPYEPVKSSAPYEPINSAQKVVAAKAPQPPKALQQAVSVAQAETQSTKAPQNILNRGIKVVEPQPVAMVSLRQDAPKWETPGAANAQRKPAEMPEIEDVLDAQAEAVIPIKTTRSKDIFVSRQEMTEEELANIGPAAAASAPEIAQIAKAPAPTSAPVQQKLQPVSWEAKAGEDIKIVLARWSERAGTDLVWEADRGGALVEDVKVQGTFEQAVNDLLTRNGDALGLNGAMRGEPGQQVAAAEPQAPMTLISANSQSAPQTAQTNLKSFLTDLGRKEGFKVMWNADRDFGMKYNIKSDGQTENTLRAALEQFDSDPVRPVGQFNINPDTGEKILVIESERTL